jgi:hypothetical protein
MGVELINEPVREMRSVFDDLAKQGRLQGFCEWQGNIHAQQHDHHSAFLCGALIESGRLAIGPMLRERGHAPLCHAVGHAHDGRAD